MSDFNFKEDFKESIKDTRDGSDEKRKRGKPVFTIIERVGQKQYFMRIGIAWVNRDESLTVKLDGLPTNGSLFIRDWKPWELERREQWQQQQQHQQGGVA